MITCEKKPSPGGLRVRRETTGRRENQPGFVNMGAALLLAVFLVITLVVFALLALSGAGSDLEFSREAARQKTLYYSSCSRSEEILSQVDQAVARSLGEGKKPDFQGLDVEVMGDTVTWQVPVDETRVLRAAYSCTDRAVTCWRVEPLEDWEENQPIWNP